MFLAMADEIVAKVDTLKGKATDSKKDGNAIVKDCDALYQKLVSFSHALKNDSLAVPQVQEKLNDVIEAIKVLLTDSPLLSTEGVDNTFKEVCESLVGAATIYHADTEAAFDEFFYGERSHRSLNGFNLDVITMQTVLKRLRGTEDSQVNESPLRQYVDLVLEIRRLSLEIRSEHAVDPRQFQETAQKLQTYLRLGNERGPGLFRAFRDFVGAYEDAQKSGRVIYQATELLSLAYPHLILSRRSDLEHVVQEFISSESTFFEEVNALNEKLESVNRQMTRFIRSNHKDKETCFGETVRLVGASTKAIKTLTNKLENESFGPLDRIVGYFLRISPDNQSTYELTPEFNEYFEVISALSQGTTAQKLSELFTDLSLDFHANSALDALIKMTKQEKITLFAQKLPRVKLFIEQLLKGSKALTNALQGTAEHQASADQQFFLETILTKLDESLSNKFSSS